MENGQIAHMKKKLIPHCGILVLTLLGAIFTRKLTVYWKTSAKLPIKTGKWICQNSDVTFENKEISAGFSITNGKNFRLYGVMNL